jgi:hypothetical protein
MGPIASSSMHENHKLIMHLNITPCMENCRVLNHGIPDLDEPSADQRNYPSLLACDQLGNRIVQQGVRRQGVTGESRRRYVMAAVAVEALAC